MFGRDLSTEENSVRGTLVTGLTQADIELLDIFEGNVLRLDVLSLEYCLLT